jgi:hypothetical protein
MASNKAEDWLDDLETVGDYAAEKIGSTIGQTPVVKAIGQVLANPTPQEVGAQVAGLAKSASNTLQESFGGDPVDTAINYGPGAIASIYKTFHGTASPVKAFKKEFLGSATGAKSAKEGFWFTDNPKVAESYATFAAETTPIQKLIDEADKMEALAQKTGKEKYWVKNNELLAKAEELEAKITKEGGTGQNVMPTDIELENPLIIDAGGETFAYFEADINKAIRLAKKTGRDGVIIKNLDDSATFSNMPSTHFLVFDPKKIKSSISGKILAEEFLDQ